jgi:hypothetical protein
MQYHRTVLSYHPHLEPFHQRQEKFARQNATILRLTSKMYKNNHLHHPPTQFLLIIQLTPIQSIPPHSFNKPTTTIT